ncbi:hypothetical protein KH5_17450 [Urechidicola sp. KH5]
MSFSQNIDELSDETMAFMKAEGYKFIEEIRGEVSQEVGIAFNQKKFIYGYTYKVIMYSPKIKDCFLTVQQWDDYEDWVQDLKVEVEFIQDIQYRISVAEVHQYNDTKGGMHLFSNTSEKIQVQALLFYR